MHVVDIFCPKCTVDKILQSGFFWPTLFKDTYKYCAACDRCQRVGNISKKNEIPLQSILVVELFDVWGIDFVGPFSSPRSNKYILVIVDYVSKWVEARTGNILLDPLTRHEFVRKNQYLGRA